MQEWLKGRKTYFVLAAAAILWFLESVGLMPPGTLDSAAPMLGLAGGATVTDKLNRLVNK